MGFFSIVIIIGSCINTESECRKGTIKTPALSKMASQAISQTTDLPSDFEYNLSDIATTISGCYQLNNDTLLNLSIEPNATLTYLIETPGTNCGPTSCNVPIQVVVFSNPESRYSGNIMFFKSLDLANIEVSINGNYYELILSRNMGSKSTISTSTTISELGISNSDTLKKCN